MSTIGEVDIAEEFGGIEGLVVFEASPEAGEQFAHHGAEGLEFFLTAPLQGLVFDTDQVEHVAAAIRGHMTGAACLSVPLVVDVGTGDNWDEAH